MAPPWLPPKKEGPPPPRAWLSRKVQERTVARPWLSSPPPKTSTALEGAVAVLPLKVTRSRVRAAPASLGGPGCPAAPGRARKGSGCRCFPARRRSGGGAVQAAGETDQVGAGVG